MTLILSLANRDHVIQLCDRRLTTNGRVCDEESEKSGAIVTDNARLLFGFTGLARALGVEMQHWILDALFECAAPDSTANNTLAPGTLLVRLRDKATKEFRELPPLRRLTARDKCMTVLFTGYVYSRDPPALVRAVLSNFYDPASGHHNVFAADEFALYTEQEQMNPRPDNPVIVDCVGIRDAVGPPEVRVCVDLLLARKNPKEIVGKATQLMRRMADKPVSGGAVGKQITWLRLPAALDQPVESGYDTNVPSDASYMPSMIVLTRSGRSVVYQAAFEKVGPDTTPLFVQRVPRNSPCPCGSGQRYKRCHGQKTRIKRGTRAGRR
jgi:hypothetical protein